MSFRRSIHRRGLDSTDNSFHRFDLDDTDDPFASAILGFADRPDHRGDGRDDENNKNPYRLFHTMRRPSLTASHPAM